MIKPYQNNIRITKDNSMFNTLPKSYEFHSTKNQYFIYETQILLNIELPKPKDITEKLKIINGDYSK